MLLLAILLLALPLSVCGAVAFHNPGAVQTDTIPVCQVLNGIPGIPGVPGAAGSNGLPGPPGPKGDASTGSGSGASGPQGPPGLDGVQGPAGPRSVPGKMGPSGPPGPTGPSGGRGPLGLRGAAGPVGPSGGRGVKGEKGDAGQTRHSSFLVGKTTTQRGDTGDIITFDEATTNIGDDFNLQEGKFTCEIPGVYVFSYTVMVFGGTAGTSLFKNEDQVVGTYSRNGNSNIDQSTVSAVLQLESGDKVWVAFTHSGQIYTESYKFTSFVGYLLHEL